MKKIIAFSDFHDKRTWYRRATSLIENIKPDIVVIAGDLSNFGGIAKIDKLVKGLNHDNVYYVWGNMDGKIVTDELKHGTNLHLNPVKINDLFLLGLGGDERSFEKNLPEFENIINKTLHEHHKYLILISHIPPYGYGDLIKTYLENPKRNVGSKKYLELLKKFQPTLAICGHIHEARGIYKLGNTNICNVGKEGMEIEFQKSIRIRDLIEDEN